MYIACAQNSFYHFRTIVTRATFNLLPAAAFLVSSDMPTDDWIRGETVLAVKSDNLLFRLHISITMLELSIEVSSNPLTEVCVHCSKLLSKVSVEQHLQALAYVISTMCKMTHKLLMSNMWKSMDNMWVWCKRVLSWDRAVLYV